MYFSDLLKKQPLLRAYATEVPQEIDGNFFVKKFPPQTTIICKDSDLTHVGILLSGCYRAIDEHKNGYIYVLERRKPVAFIGALACISYANKTSARFEAVKECEVAFIKASDFDFWMMHDPVFLRRVCCDYTKKFYQFFYSTGAELLYASTKYLLYKYFLSLISKTAYSASPICVLRKTRRDVSEENGIPLKTVNRTVAALVQDGAVSIVRGKVGLTLTQYRKASHYLEKYGQHSKNGRCISSDDHTMAIAQE